MGYNKKELMELPDKEKLMPVTVAEIALAEERLKMHQENPGDGLTCGKASEKLRAKYGF